MAAIALPAAMLLTAGGSLVSAAGTIAGGNAAAAAGMAGQGQKNFEARQQEMQAQESRAASQRSALDVRRREELLRSTLIARAAAGGSSATDPGIIDLAGDIAQRGEYEALTEMYKGENRARGLEDAALGSRLTGQALAAEGAAKKKAAKLSAIGTIIGGAGSMFSQYNQAGRR